MIAQFGLEDIIRGERVIVTDPLSYLDMLCLQAGAEVIVTDSGGVQKEAYYHGVPSVVLRENTEWIELVELGWAKLAPINREKIVAAIRSAQPGEVGESPYGRGDTAESICKIMRDSLMQ